MATDVDIKQLLEAGAHFGHKTERWHPKMAPYIHSKRGGTHIIDLTKTVEGLEEALAFLTKTAAAGKQILLVGTKRQAQDIVRKARRGNWYAFRDRALARRYADQLEYHRRARQAPARSGKSHGQRRIGQQVQQA